VWWRRAGGHRLCALCSAKGAGTRSSRLVRATAHRYCSGVSMGTRDTNERMERRNDRRKRMKVSQRHNERAGYATEGVEDG
jgi:hypothetical protein